MTITSVDQARQLAEHRLDEDIGKRFVIIASRTREYKFGWIFFYETKKFVETKNPVDQIPGIGPIAVTRDGNVQYITTSAPPEIAIRNFERQLDSKR